MRLSVVLISHISHFKGWKNSSIRLLENLILIAVGIKNNKVDNKSNGKMTENLAKSNNLSNLSKPYIVLLTLIL